MSDEEGVAALLRDPSGDIFRESSGITREGASGLVLKLDSASARALSPADDAWPNGAALTLGQAPPLAGSAAPPLPGLCPPWLRAACCGSPLPAAFACCLVLPVALVCCGSPPASVLLPCCCRRQPWKGEQRAQGRRARRGSCWPRSFRPVPLAPDGSAAVVLGRPVPLAPRRRCSYVRSMPRSAHAPAS